MGYIIEFTGEGERLFVKREHRHNEATDNIREATIFPSKKIAEKIMRDNIEDEFKPKVTYDDRTPDAENEGFMYTATMAIRKFLWVMGLLREKYFYIHYRVYARPGSAAARHVIDITQPVAEGTAVSRTRYYKFDAEFMYMLQEGFKQESVPKKETNEYSVQFVSFIRIGKS